MRDKYRKSISYIGASSFEEVDRFAFDIGKITEEQPSPPSVNSTATPNTNLGKLFSAKISDQEDRGDN